MENDVSILLARATELGIDLVGWSYSVGNEGRHTPVYTIKHQDLDYLLKGAEMLKEVESVMGGTRD